MRWPFGPPHLTLKPSKKEKPPINTNNIKSPKPQKPTKTFFHKLSGFLIHFFTATAVFCWKHYKNCVFRRTQLPKTQLVKNTFSPIPKKPPRKKGSLLVLGCFRRSHIFYGFSWFWPKQIVCTRKRVVFPSRYKCCQAIFAKIFSIFHICLWPPSKTQCLWGFGALFHFLFPFQQHRKLKQKMEGFLLEYPHVWHPDNFEKTHFLAQIDIICVFGTYPETLLK